MIDLEIQQDKDIWMYGATYTLGAARFDSTVTMADSLIHFGDTDTKIRFPAVDTISMETAGSERVRITSGGRLLIGTSTSNISGSFSAVVSTGAQSNNGGFQAHYNAGSYGGGNNFPLGGGGGAGTGKYNYSGANNGAAATANTGSGGGGSPGDNTATGGAGGSGIVILRYDSSITATYTSGVTYSTTVVGNDKVDQITATTNNSQTVTFS